MQLGTAVTRGTRTAKIASSNNVSHREERPEWEGSGFCHYHCCRFERLCLYLAHCPEFVARYTHFGRSQVIGSSCCCKQPLLMELASFDSGWSAFRTIYIRGKLVVGSDLCYWHPDLSLQLNESEAETHHQATKRHGRNSGEQQSSSNSLKTCPAGSTLAAPLIWGCMQSIQLSFVWCLNMHRFLQGGLRKQHP
jgi:hypothetical protein